jgi:aryl sulfotransferase
MLAALSKSGLEDETIGKLYPTIPADPAAYFRIWLSEGLAGATGGLPFVSYFDLENTYWTERRRPNLLMVHYRDLKADLAGEMRRVAKFLEITVPESVLPSLVEAATFEEMRRSGDQLMPRLLATFEGGTDRFFFKGENDRWRGVLDERDLATYERKLKSRVSPDCAKWLELGRLAGLDPRTAKT